ncbi:sulfotransferase domain-containing protein [Actinomadura harenae]|uniref:Sulfotransferase domain-containing protein n=1 Tax=Actinomadura harenae TaxID=2483351 RepID=A0A3M2LPL9_9ACTN|nr:sulfotransferase domain-containing protein [Actinomadura harenae]RMI39347.1 sulfotransferase domain-containing protein [Actinomadura harenae]
MTDPTLPGPAVTGAPPVTAPVTQPATAPVKQPVTQPPPAVYRTLEDDSTRWLGFPFRPGDVVVSTGHKSGTTWMQMICVLLVFQRPEPPAPLAELSPWLDQLVRPAEEVYALLADQPHRRVIKTHTPLDGLPADPRATFVVVARDPLDVAVSRYHVYDEDPDRRPADPERAWLLSWLARDDWEPDSLNRLMWHVTDAWERRDDPNVLLVHYADLAADLPGQMRRVADRLGITVPEDRWPSLLEAATFRRMRADAARLVPAGRERLKDARTFFRAGRSGSGRALLTPEEFAAFHGRLAATTPPDLLSWLIR